MKFIKQIQEDGLFGIADSMEKSLSRIASYKAAKQRLYDLGCTDYDILEIEQAKWGGCGFILEVRPDPQWPNSHTESAKRLMRLNIIYFANDEFYILTREGSDFRENLLATKPAPKATGSSNNVVALHPSTVEQQMDVNLGRDGLLTTCSKLWWVWTHSDKIKEAAEKKQLADFTAGHQQIEDAVQLIATSEQRVARKLLDQVPEKPAVYWTEEEQRKTNDLYWMSGSAFWLNPMGLFANPTPAPDWWTPPEDYHSLTQKRLEAFKDDTVERSLLAPPEKPKSLANEIKEKNTEEHLGGMTDQEISALLQLKLETFDSPVSEYQIKLANKYSHFGLNKLTNLVTALEADGDAIAWSYAMEGVPHTIAGRGTITYGELLRIYEAQRLRASNAVDYILDYLDNLDNGRENESYERWHSTITAAGAAKQTKYIKDVTGAPKRNTIVEQRYDNQNKPFFLVEFDNEVRGFTDRLEAETWLGEQRTYRDQERRRAEEKKAPETQRTDEELRMARILAGVETANDRASYMAKGTKGPKGEVGPPSKVKKPESSGGPKKPRRPDPYHIFH